ncbi:DNA primase family protein [Bacillus albus]|jgi:putative DNA primase/helicase|uniref:DNA primase family protein n=1 Tax=Bacillus albus TaxID=2026189 RepID=UPI0010204ADA|nr:phage/plasmid primase, P4 family [Bacillus albus]
MKNTSDKTVLTVVNGIKKDDSSKEVDAQTFEKSSNLNNPTNSINETKMQNQERINSYITKEITIHGNVKYKIDHIALIENILDENEIINNSVMTAAYNKKDGIWIQHADAHLKSIITKKIKIAFSIQNRNTALELLKDTIFTHGSNLKFNAKHNAVVFKNGTYYFPDKRNDKTGKWTNTFNSKDYSTTRIPHNFNFDLFESDKKPTKTLKALSSFMDEEEKEMLFQYLGSCFYKRQNPRGILIMTGDGKNGKSRIIEMFQYFIGEENYSTAPLKDLVEKQFAKSSLLNKHLNACGDIGGDFFKESAELKGLTGGDTIYAEFKGENGFSFENFARLLFSANELPKFKDDTEAITSRMLFLEMPYKPTDDDVDNLVSSYKKEAELIIAYSIKRFIIALKNQKFTEAKRSLEIKKEWTKSSNNVSEFAHECCEFKSEYTYSITKTYKAYKEFCKQNGFEACNSRTFKQRFIKFTNGEKKTNKMNVYLGVAIYDPKEE